MHAAALNLLVRLRRVVADPPALESIASPLFPGSTPMTDPSVIESSSAADSATMLPLEAQPASVKKRYQQRRRQCDPLGEGQPCTWRSLIIKVAAEVTVSARRIVVRLSSSWPNQEYFQHVCSRLFAHIRPDPTTG